MGTEQLTSMKQIAPEAAGRRNLLIYVDIAELHVISRLNMEEDCPSYTNYAFIATGA